MPHIAPIGVRIGKCSDGPESAKGPAIDATKGYRLQRLDKGLYVITNNAYQLMFMTYEGGVIVIDAPPSYAGLIRRAIAEVTAESITHLVYSHSHLYHIGGVRGLGAIPVVIAQEETKRLLMRANDPNRPIPTVTSGIGTRLGLEPRRWCFRITATHTARKYFYRGACSEGINGGLYYFSRVDAVA